MPRQITCPVHKYFTYNPDENRSECNKCGLKLRGRHATNLRHHMLSKHHFEVKDDTVYEYVVGSPKSTASNDSAEESDAKPTNPKQELRESRSSVVESSLPRRNTSNVPRGKANEKRLIERLTEEKIYITALQKDLVEKELEEKNLKVELLQKEMEHKNVMHELEKQEMLLRIEVLKANLRKGEN